jgi:hypothetical protein
MAKRSYWRDPKVAERRRCELERALPTKRKSSKGAHDVHPQSGPKDVAGAHARRESARPDHANDVGEYYPHQIENSQHPDKELPGVRASQKQ